MSLLYILETSLKVGYLSFQRKTILFQVNENLGLSFLQKSNLALYKFQGRQLDGKKINQNVEIKYLEQCSLDIFSTKLQKTLKSVFLLKFVCVNTAELLKNIKLT